MTGYGQWQYVQLWYFFALEIVQIPSLPTREKMESKLISKSSSFHQGASDPDRHSLGLETVICSIKIQYFNSIYMLQISHSPSKLTFTSFKKTQETPQKKDNGAQYWQAQQLDLSASESKGKENGMWKVWLLGFLGCRSKQKTVQLVLYIKHGKKSWSKLFPR